jgi:hypothetical protein
MPAAKKRIDATPPTPAQMKRDTYALETMPGLRGKVARYRKIRQLEALQASGFITLHQYAALKHYRHHADIADKSLTKDSLASFGQTGTSGNGIPFEVMNAIQVTTSIERAAGRLVDILRAVVVDDKSLSQWVKSCADGI